MQKRIVLKKMDFSNLQTRTHKFFGRGRISLLGIFILGLPLVLIPVQAGAIGLLTLLFIEALVFRRWPFLRTPLDIPLALFLATIALSLLTAKEGPPSFEKATSFWVIGTYFVITAAIRELRPLKILLAAYLALAALIGIYGFFQYQFGFYIFEEYALPAAKRIIPETPGHYSAIGFFGSRTVFVQAFLFPIGLTLGFLTESGLSKSWRLAASATFAILLLVPTFTFARAGWLGTGAAIVMIAIIRRRTFRWPYVAALLIVLTAIALLIPAIRQRIFSIFSMKKNSERLLIWKRSLEMFGEHPLTGIGYGNFSRICHRYYDQKPKEGKITMRTWAHNIFLSMAVETGILGLLAFLMVWVAFFIHAWRIYRRLEPGWRRSFVAGALAAVTAHLAAGQFHDPFYFGQIGFPLWFIIGTVMIIGRQAPFSDGPQTLRTAPAE